MATRGSRPSRRRACVPWRGGAKSPPARSWSSCENEIRASLSGDGGWVGMCASALRNCAPQLRKVRLRQTLSISVLMPAPQLRHTHKVLAGRALQRFPSLFFGTTLGRLRVPLPTCTIRATNSSHQNFFSTDNIPEINHSQRVSPRAVASTSCRAIFSC